MAANRHASRRSKLLRALRKQKLNAMLVTSEQNVTYLTGFKGDSTWLLLTKSNALLISDTRYTTQIADECPDVDVVIRDAGGTQQKLAAKAIKKAKLSSVAFESDAVTHATQDGLSDVVSSELVPTSGIIEMLRAVKDAGEIADIRKAVWMAERGMLTLRAGLKPEMTELEVAHNLEHAMRGFGATRAGFDPIVAVGPQAALPHAHPGSSEISDHGLLLVDWGAETPGGYRSDLTRILITGKVSPKVQTVYEVVLKAQVAAIKAIRPGANCQDIDSIARNIIGKAGYGKYFGHGLGHGFGLQIHEQPRFSPLSEQILEPGMVITVEPGIYLPGRFGIRIEDDILVTKAGYEVLSTLPTDFDSCYVDFLASR